MPDDLVIQRPKPVNSILGIAAAVPIVLLIAWFVRLFKTKQSIHFDDPWVNLGAHAMLILVPLFLAFAITREKIEFQETDEQLLGASSYLQTFRGSWWMLSLLWPAGLYAFTALIWEMAMKHLLHPEQLSVSPGRALWIMTGTFLLGLFYLNLLFNKSPVRISDAGLRVGITQYFEWENLDHFSRHEDLWSIYHRARPDLPATHFRLRDPSSVEALERHIAEKGVCVSPGLEPIPGSILAFATAGPIITLLLAFALHSSGLSIINTAMIIMAVCVILTLIFERQRALNRITRTTARIGPA